MTCQYQLCNCNRTMPLNAVSGERLGAQLGGTAIPVATQLCGCDSDRFVEAVRGADTVVVGCTQERALFEELAHEQGGAGGNSAPVRFVNLRETGGWSSQAYASLPKMAALLADAALPAQEPVPAVGYVSEGRVLIVGPAVMALQRAEQLQQAQDELSITVLLTDSSDQGNASLPAVRRYNVFSGTQPKLSGWLGAFKAEWRQQNPIDLDLCIRCNACIEACPEDAIGPLYQVDQEICTRQGDCVRACGSVGAIDFSRATPERQAEFDLVLDLCEPPLLRMQQPPQGYVAPGSDPQQQMQALLGLARMVGEFEKPKYFAYKETLCAHGRNRKTGCHACIDICSAEAIRNEGDKIRVEPHLCMGCGACTTVCPSGALRYAYPDAPYLGRRIKAMLGAYGAAGGEEARVLLHAAEEGGALIAALGRGAKMGRKLQGMPANVIPVDVHHMAAAGLDVWLAALCHGASGVMVLASGSEAPAYRTALREQIEIGRCILSELGYGEARLDMIEADSAQELDLALHAERERNAPIEPAGFNVMADKRVTLDLALTHLYEHAPQQVERLALPAGAPFGALALDTDACTLCMACTGACPSSALMSTAERPQLRFVEKNCVQCGLCVHTCPENAITLVPGLAFGEAARTPVTLHEAEPFHCIRCSKPIGTARVIESMLSRLAGHGAFAAHPERLKMCGDCRVADMMNARQAGAIDAGQGSGR